ncbi:MAG TPA: DsbA family protein [Solirubrobacteraceae bacterium]|jgi:2-hydroxychromene-2-carboxylate isomerase|nr:DsbA family protein [Solirubrobacteraceae bacterium]
MTSPPRLYFSFRSPFSWLLVERLRRVAPDALEQVELFPYWEPDMDTAAGLARHDAVIHYAPMSKAKHLYILQDTKRLATRLGLTLSWPVDVEPWWEPAHLGWLQARRLGGAGAFYDGIVAARWRAGLDISKREVIRDVADSVGLDGNAICAAVDDREVRDLGVDCLLQAYRDDVFGVPYMRVGWRRFWGFDRLADFLAEAGLHLEAGPGELARSSGRQDDEGGLSGVPLAVRELVGCYDNDTAGGCG